MLSKLNKQCQKILLRIMILLMKNQDCLIQYKNCIKLNSPSYISACILDLSKILIYNYWYTLKNKYKDDTSMSYIDTDGFVCNSRNNDDIYKDMYGMDIFYMSCYVKSFKYDRCGEYEMEKVKDECSFSPIVEVISLKTNYMLIK